MNWGSSATDPRLRRVAKLLQAFLSPSQPPCFMQGTLAASVVMKNAGMRVLRLRNELATIFAFCLLCTTSDSSSHYRSHQTWRHEQIWELSCVLQPCAGLLSWLWRKVSVSRGTWMGC